MSFLINLTRFEMASQLRTLAAIVGLLVAPGVHMASAQTSMFGYDPNFPAPASGKKFELVQATAGHHGVGSPQGEWTFTLEFNDAVNFQLPDITGALTPSKEDLARSPGPEKAFSAASAAAAAAKRRFDWRDQNKVTPIRSQGRCGSCWAFGAIGAFEGSFLKVNNADPKQLNFSEQNLLNCTRDSSCAGGYHDKAADRLKTNGVDTEKDEPYRGSELDCRGSSFPYKAENYGYVDKNAFIPTQDKIKATLEEHGPLAVAMQATASFQAYRSGVFNEQASGQNINHIVTLIGWNDDLGAWIIKNSWGTSWGQNAGIGNESDRGYAYVTYGAANIGAYALYIDAAKGTPRLLSKQVTSLNKLAGRAFSEMPQRVLPVNAQVDESDNEGGRMIPVGGTLTVTIPQEPGAGYFQHLAPFNTSLLQLEHQETSPPPGTPPQQAGGYELISFTFKALAPGATTLTFSLTGPGGDVAETEHYAVEIERPF